jgi:hypothetical protein
VDPINPIIPGPSAIPLATQRLERPERISRENDHPRRDAEERRRREPEREPVLDPEPGDDDEGQPHVDVRV